MRWRPWLAVGLVAGFASGAGAETPPAPTEDAPTPAARDILKRAFDNFYACDTSAELELEIQSRFGSRRRVLDVATKQIEGLRRGLARLTFPPELRGTSYLMIENTDRRHDTFIYLPALRRVRRVSTAQLDDSFVGSDLTYEDMERRREEEYDAELLPPETVEGEPAWVVSARPRHHEAYERVEVVVAEADAAMLELRFFDRSADTPYRVMRMPRDAMHTEDGHVLPTLMEIENLKRGTSTRAHFRELDVNPQLDARHFEPSWLERDRDFRPAASE